MPDVETVWGAISPEDLGITMMHEHTLCDLRCSAKEPAEASMKKLFESPVTIEVLGALRRDPTRCKDNLVLTDEALVVDELMWFKKWGGRSIVDLTLPGVGRDPYAQRRISAATGHVNLLTYRFQHIFGNLHIHFQHGIKEGLKHLGIQDKIHIPVLKAP